MEGASAVRVPGDASLQKRRERRAAGVVNLDERVYQRLLEACESSALPAAKYHSAK
jgi:LDH2 family malate/lactate/ureidoglycolate dehydrogenase